MEYSNEELSREILMRLGYNNLKNTTKLTVLCPNPDHQDHHPSCSIDTSKMLYHCFSCGFGGSLHKLYKERFGHSIYRDLGISIPIKFRQEEEYIPNFDVTPETHFIFTGKFYPLDSIDASKNWIKKRGFTVDLLSSLKVKLVKGGMVKDSNDLTNKEQWQYFNNNIIIPIYEKGKLISFEARELYGEEYCKNEWIRKGKDITQFNYRKVIYPRFSSVNTLFEFDKLDKNKKLYVTEGLMDVISLRTHQDYFNSTCLFHALPTERQFYLLSQFKEVCFIPNNDKAGMSQLRKIKEKNPKFFVLTLPTSLKDINDILQKKDKRFESIQDLKNMKWGREKTLFNFDIDTYERSLS